MTSFVPLMYSSLHHINHLLYLRSIFGFSSLGIDLQKNIINIFQDKVIYTKQTTNNIL